MASPPPEPSSSPRYARIAQVLRARLEAHDGSRDAPFATEQALCEEFGVSRTTVRNALGHLKREGLLTSRRGVGTNGTAAERPRRVVRCSGDPLHGMLKSKPRVVSVGPVAAPAAAREVLRAARGRRRFSASRACTTSMASPCPSCSRTCPPASRRGVSRSDWRLPMHDLLWERFGVRIARSVHTLRVGRAMADIAGDARRRPRRSGAAHPGLHLSRRRHADPLDREFLSRGSLRIRRRDGMADAAFARRAPDVARHTASSGLDPIPSNATRSLRVSHEPIDETHQGGDPAAAPARIAPPRLARRLRLLQRAARRSGRASRPRRRPDRACPMRCSANPTSASSACATTSTPAATSRAASRSR